MTIYLDGSDVRRFEDARRLDRRADRLGRGIDPPFPGHTNHMGVLMARRGAAGDSLIYGLLSPGHGFKFYYRGRSWRNSPGPIGARELTERPLQFPDFWQYLPFEDNFRAGRDLDIHGFAP